MYLLYSLISKLIYLLSHVI